MPSWQSCLALSLQSPHEVHLHLDLHTSPEHAQQKVAHWLCSCWTKMDASPATLCPVTSSRRPPRSGSSGLSSSRSRL